MENKSKTESEDLNDSKSKTGGGGVDDISAPIVDPSKISPKYLKMVKKVNHKFAEFLGQFVHAYKKELPKKFLNKQIYWLKNIGSYYQVNVIRNTQD